MRGKVLKLNDTYGFIRGEDGVTRMFIPSLMATPEHDFNDLVEGMRVTFDPIEHEKGLRAGNIRIEPASATLNDEGGE